MNFLNRFKKPFMVIMLLLCIAAVLFTLNDRFHLTILDNALGFVVTPVQKWTTGAARWVSDKTGYFADIAEIEAENKRLQATVEALSAENKRLKLVEVESKKLAELLKVDEKYPDFPKVGAQMIAKDTSNWFSTFIIDKGTNNGFCDNLAVLASGGLVGRIIKASAHSSEVITVIDDRNAVSVKCVRTEDLGLVRGDMSLAKNGLCRMDFVDIDAQIMEGDELITSPLGDIYPPGIAVGYVKEVKIDAKGLTKYAIVQPVADFQNIETVLVIIEKYNPASAEETALEE